MAFSAPFSRIFRPPFGPGLSAAVAASWWLSGGIASANCLAAYQPKGAANLDASYINLANPGTYNAAPGVAPTWDVVSGWIGGGTNWLTTGLTPVDPVSVIVRLSNVGNAQCILGCDDNTYKFRILPSQSARTYMQHGGSTYFTPGTTSGVLAMCPGDMYLDGVYKGACGGITDLPAKAIYLLATNGVAGVGSIIIAKIQAVAIYNIDLSTPQVLAISTAMAAL